MADSNEAPRVKPLNEWDKFVQSLSIEKRIELERIQTETEFLSWALENEVRYPRTLWSQRYESLFLQDSPQEEKETKPEEKGSNERRIRREIEPREPTYDEFQKSSKEEAEKKANEWVNNPNISVAQNRQEAYSIAFRKTHDDFVKNNERLAEKWIKEHNDTFLASAIERKRQEEERKRKEKTAGRIQQAERTSRSETRIKLRSFFRKNSQSLSSSAARLGNRTLTKPILRAPSIIARAAGPRIVAGAARAGLVFSRILAGITGAFVGMSVGTFAIIVGAIVIFILIFIVILKIIYPGISDPTNAINPIKSTYPGIGYNVYGPRSAVKGQDFTDTVELIYDLRTATCSIENITIVDMIPTGATVVDTKTTGKFTKTDNTILWKLSPENKPYSESSIIKFYHFEIVFNSKDNLTVQNGIYIEGCGNQIIPVIQQQPAPVPIDTGDTTGLYEGADSLPSNNTCGEYAGVMSDLSKSWPEMGENTNFGDPACSYKPEKFTQLLEITETKTENIPFWKDIINLEGAIMTVGNLRDSDGKIIRHTNGPFGKFQMSRSTPPGEKWTKVSPRGDTTWQKQIENAVGYNKSLAQSGNNFGYWGSAMCLCWWPKYRTKSYCTDIVNKGPGNTYGPRAPEVNCPTNTGLTCNTAYRCQNDKAAAIGERGPRQ